MKTVRIRRGNQVKNNIPPQGLVDQIKKGKLKNSDEISSDGKKWIRLDQHPQLTNYFSGPAIEKKEMIRESGSSGLLKGFCLGMAVAIALIISYNLYQSQSDNNKKIEQFANTSTAYADTSKISDKSTLQAGALDSDVKSNLHNLYLACKAYWADEGPRKPCTLAIAKGKDYGFILSSDVEIKIRNFYEEDFLAGARHKEMDAYYYQINSGANIILKQCPLKPQYYELSNRRLNSIFIIYGWHVKHIGQMKGLKILAPQMYILSPHMVLFSLQM